MFAVGVDLHGGYDLLLPVYLCEQALPNWNLKIDYYEKYLTTDAYFTKFRKWVFWLIGVDTNFIKPQ